MLATASSRFFGRLPPGGVAASSRAAQLSSSVMQLASAFASALNVASVEVSVPFGVVASAEPTAPVAGSARFAAIRTAFRIPYVLPSIFRPSTNWANAFPVATVGRSFTTTSSGSAPALVPIALASIASSRVASTNSNGSASTRPRGMAYATSKLPSATVVLEPSRTQWGLRSTKAAKSETL